MMQRHSFNAVDYEYLVVDSFLRGDFGTALKAWHCAKELRQAGDTSSEPEPLGELTPQEFESFAEAREAEGAHELAAKARARAAELRGTQ